MTSYAPGQATGPNLTAPVTLVLESPARHRPDDAGSYGPPAWLPLTLTAVAVVSAWFAIYVFLSTESRLSFLLMGLAVFYAVTALAVDVWAAVQARRTGGDE